MAGVVGRRSTVDREVTSRGRDRARTSRTGRSRPRFRGPRPSDGRIGMPRMLHGRAPPHSGNLHGRCSDRVVESPSKIGRGKRNKSAKESSEGGQGYCKKAPAVGRPRASARQTANVTVRLSWAWTVEKTGGGDGVREKWLACHDPGKPKLGKL